MFVCNRTDNLKGLLLSDVVRCAVMSDLADQCVAWGARLRIEWRALLLRLTTSSAFTHLDDHRQTSYRLRAAVFQS